MPEVIRQRDLPLCDSCVPRGGCKLGVDDLRMTADGDVQGQFRVPEDVRGHVVAHGGWIAWVFDEALGLLPSGRGKWAVTRSLSIRYLRPVPVGAEVTVAAWLEGSAGAVWSLQGELRLSEEGTLLASASGEWAAVQDVDKHYERARQWSYQVTGRR